jgi:hypothetical protein
MAQTAAGLPNGGVTTHYAITYDDSLTAADGENRASALMGVCETDFTTMQGWFGGISLPYQIPYGVQIVPGPGSSASWGSGPPITLVPGNGSTLDLVRYLLVAEVTEMFMLQQGLGWSPLASSEGTAGEGLSHFLATQLLINIGSSLRPSSIANLWLNSPRGDFVNHVDPADNTNSPKTGCAVLFLWYLFTQLGFGVNAIVGAGNPQLAGVYRNLTGDTNDPFPFFKSMLDAAFPSTTASSIPGPNRDNPYPLGSLSFWMDKNTYGHDEVQDVVASTAAGTFSKAFWLVLEGFNRQVLGGATPAAPSGPALAFTGISFPVDPMGAEFERPADQLAPQRVRFPYDTHFTTAGSPPFPAAGSDEEIELDGAITVAGKQFTAKTDLEFVGGADPYFTNVDPAAQNVFYLSQDLRVFTATPNMNSHPVAGGPAMTDSIAGAYTYIQQLIAWLNQNFSDPGGADPFSVSGGVLPGQSGAYTGDSSVVPSFDVGFARFDNYNFALARVRLQGASGTQAQNVRVFFRLWGTQSADTDFQPGSTYLSHLDAAGKPDWPLVPPDAHTIPFFATGNSPNLSDPNNPEYGTNGVNNQSIMISSGHGRWAYFGCFLNVYDPANVVHGQPVQALLAGDHHCIVAEIAYDAAPIVNANGITESPENSDKLAQRNLQITHSGNPGWPATHRVPQTFDVRPSPVGTQGADLLGYPDELMIDWGSTPKGTVAELYWPQAQAADIVQVASALYGAHRLRVADAETIRCEVEGGITYVPIPSGAPQNLAGLITLDLPSTVVYGQQFEIVVRRVSTRRFEEPPVIEIREAAQPADRRSAPARSRKRAHGIDYEPPPEGPDTPPETEAPTWRYVTGTFQITVPVTEEATMLPPAEDALAIFKWRLQAMPASNRWHKVLSRYIDYLSEKVDALGGDAAGIPPSLKGRPEKRRPHVRPEEDIDFTGKIVGLSYDRFGDFEGFMLRLESGHRRYFRAREHAVEQLVRTAWLERFVVSVYVDRGAADIPETIILRRAPAH